MVEPVKLFAAVLFRDDFDLEPALERMGCHWGRIDYRGGAHLFELTDYYEREMGAGLKRCLVSFEDLVSPEILAGAKSLCITIEEDLRRSGRRTVNLDIGYLDHNKIVLASCKAAGQKIYLSKGIYADLMARYSRGRYRPFEWTFFDFRDGRYDPELSRIRTAYLQSRKALKSEC